LINSDRGARHSSQRWSTFVRNHAKAIIVADFLTVVTARFQFLYVFVVMEVGTRRIADVYYETVSGWFCRIFATSRGSDPGNPPCVRGERDRRF